MVECGKYHFKYCFKIAVLISDKKSKVKSKCAECFTYRAFFDKINDKYDLEELVKHFFLH